MTSGSTERGLQSSSRQEQILFLAADGLTDKEIAIRLHLSPETVGTYWRRILTKYNACSRTEVVAKVLRRQTEDILTEAQTVRECLQEAVDHLLDLVDVSSGHVPAILQGYECLPVPVIALQTSGVIVYSNPLALRLGLRIGESILMWSEDEIASNRARQSLKKKKISGNYISLDLARLASVLRIAPIENSAVAADWVGMIEQNRR